MKTCLLALMALPSLAAAAEQLNVKLGLWEINSVTQMNGMLPLPKELTDKLTPEQRARMAAEARANAAEGPIKDMNRECITQKDLENPFNSANMKSCKQTIVSRTRTAQEARLVCSGEHKGAGVFRVSTPTPETMSGSFDLKFGEGADAMTMKAQLTGRWLSADCGDEAEDDTADDADQEPADDDEQEKD